VVRRRGQLAQAGEVHTRREHRTRAAQHDHEAAQGFAEREHQLRIERVARLGAVEDDEADVAAVLRQDQLWRG
jgi:hypothetical protein